MEMLEKQKPQEQKSKTRIHLIIDSLQDFYERIQKKLLHMTIKTKEPEMEHHKEPEIEHQKERKIEKIIQILCNF